MWPAVKNKLRNGWFVNHVVCSLFPLWICVLLIVNPTAFTGFPLWKGLAAVATEQTWLMVCASCSFLGLWGACTRHRWLCIASALILGTLHGTIATLLLISNPWVPASGTYAIIAGMSYCLMLEQTHAY